MEIEELLIKSLVTSVISEVLRVKIIIKKDSY